MTFARRARREGARRQRDGEMRRVRRRARRAPARHRRRARLVFAGVPCAFLRTVRRVFAKPLRRRRRAPPPSPAAERRERAP